MDAPLLLAEKITASVCLGMLIGLEREWAHKEAGVRSFTLVSLLGTLSWLVSPTLAFVQVGIVVVIIIVANVYSLYKDEPLLITTSLALAVTNILGMLIGMGQFFIAFACAIVVAALLSWKTELVAFTSKLTVAEIRGALLMGFITFVVYPLLPPDFIDPWHIVNPRSIWITVIIVSALSFVNHILLRQLGVKGLRYSAILGGLVNSAATTVLLGEELKASPDLATAAPADFMLADLGMIVRNGALVAIFSWVAGPQTSLAVLLILGPMAVVAGAISLIILLGTKPKTQVPGQKPALPSPLAIRSVLRFGLLFFTLTIISGLAQRLFGSLGFLVVVVLGALASAAASAVLIGIQVRLHMFAPGAAALAMYFATLVCLGENVVIFYTVTHQRTISLRLALFSLLIALSGGIALAAYFGLSVWRF
ncbi:MAG TPA: DUF4010 domain-containing protein [Ktedonobacteraceae bacterium]|nr:DUF4010 domain-containing protein [Ktedonobacteraceae bacterium]